MEAECQRVLAVRQELVDAVKTGLGANTQELWKARRRSLALRVLLLLCSCSRAASQPAV